MPYIGTSPSNGVRRKHTYTATAGQTSFSGAGSEGATLSYNDSNFVDVYQNGVKLSEADYTSTSGTAIVLAQGASVSDIVEIVVFDVFSVADTVSKTAGGTFDGDITSGGTLNIAGTTTAPSSPSAGDLWFNSATSTVSDINSKALAVYNGNSWDQMSNIFSATGGTISTYSSSGVNYNVHTFTSSGVFKPTAAATVNYLVVAGGGSGGSNIAGGGGAGGLRTGTLAVLAQSYAITVGAGGAAGQVDSGGAQSGNNGNDSIFSTITSIGGGAGGPEFSGNGNNGGSGGGGSRNGGTAGSGTSGQGNNGGNGTSSGGTDNQGSGGGGGGAGAVGVAATNSAPGNGGAGLANSITGSSVTYAGGGGGGGYNTANTSGGSGGGGNGSGSGAAATVGAANTGSGGGAGGYPSNRPGKSGGSGIVIISYAV